ncbi:DDE-type integrase/transposase/recombinase [Aureimonas sp. SK2]|uniref:DDE-type integrase/transposase/recombinase n=1 Tax=Aureimonas sp. SK2 TaxID=3015992 RepID=UPI00244458C6|nr:DDE-type integrase/transposase/recombinase [Aureimonas sp. SK2]
MKEWLTAQEIADARLPHIPATKRGVNDLAEREGWNADDFRSRKRAGRGGGMEYHIQLLPTLAQLAYRKTHIRVGSPAMPAAANDEAAAPAPAANLTDAARLERDARLAILRAFDVFAIGTRLNKGATRDLFVKRYNRGDLTVDQWVRDRVKAISVRTLARWRDEAKADRNRLAVDKSANRKGKDLLGTANSGLVEAFVLAWLAVNPHLSAATIRGYCEDEFGDELVSVSGEMKPMPPVRTFQHFIARLKTSEKVALTKITNPDAYRSTMKLSGTGTYRHITEPNDLWMIDASPLDALCTDGRWSIYKCVDIATRRAVITMSPTPSALDVGLLLRKAILRWGVPRGVKTDNGSDFVAKATQRLFVDLNIEPDVCDAYSPEQKGQVERAIKTFQHEVCPQLPGYVGHSVADRKAIEGRKSFADRMGADERETFQVELSAAELQAKIDDWIEYVYQEREHAGLGRRTPNAVAAERVQSIRRVDERALDVLLMPVAGKDGLRRMTKQGIRVDGFHYLSGSILAGTDVFVRLDPQDMGKIYAFSAKDGTFLDTCGCAELLDVNRADFVKARKAEYEAMVTERTREIRADVRRLQKGPSGIDRTIRNAKRKAALRAAQAAPNVVVLPPREEVHSTSGISAALDAATVQERRQQPTISPEAAKRHERLAAEMARPSNVKPLRTTETPQLRFRRALDIEAAIAAGAEVSTEDARWLGGYQAGPEYRGQRKVHDKFKGLSRL